MTSLQAVGTAVIAVRSKASPGVPSRIYRPGLQATVPSEVTKVNRRLSAIATSFLLMVSWLSGRPAVAQMVTTTVSVGTSPGAMAVNPVTNKIYVANYGSGTVTVIDGATNTTTTVTVGDRPTAVAVNPVTNKIYVANNGSDNVTVIDGATNAHQPRSTSEPAPRPWPSTR